MVESTVFKTHNVKFRCLHTTQQTYDVIIILLRRSPCKLNQSNSRQSIIQLVVDSEGYMGVQQIQNSIGEARVGVVLNLIRVHNSLNHV